MQKLYGLTIALVAAFSTHVNADSLPKVTGLELEGNQLSWDAQEGATGYNIHRDFGYFDTVRGQLSYTVSETGNYHVISFNDAGMFGVTRTPEEGGQPYTFVEFMTEEVTVEDLMTLPKVTGLALEGDQLSWSAQDGATGYNIHRDFQYFDTVRDLLSYTVSVPGDYHVISFNDAGMFGVTREPEEGGLPYTFVVFDGNN